jgi:hypothetical protein
MAVKARLAKGLGFLYRKVIRQFATQINSLAAKMRPTMLLPNPGMELKPHSRKILESLIFLISEAMARGYRPTQYDLVKSIFVADYHHMNKYGRPVTYDNHHAMTHGPVPTKAYDMLKPGYNWKTAYGLDAAPFSMRDYPAKGQTVREYYNPTREPDFRVLSKSDLQFLGDALEYVIKKGFAGTKDWTHELPAYKSAWARRGISDSVPMDLAALLEGDDKEGAEEIIFASKHLA